MKALSLFTAFLTALCLASPGYGEAMELPINLAPFGEQAESSLDALEKANKFSHAVHGVGIVISYGKKNGASAEDLGDAFVRALNGKDIVSRYFYYKTDRDGAAIEFHIGYSALGPWSINEAASRMKEVVARTEAMRKVEGLN